MNALSGVRIPLNILSLLFLGILLLPQLALAGGLFLSEIGTPDTGLAGAG